MMRPGNILFRLGIANAAQAVLRCPRERAESIADATWRPRRDVEQRNPIRPARRPAIELRDEAIAGASVAAPVVIAAPYSTIAIEHVARLARRFRVIAQRPPSCEYDAWEGAEFVGRDAIIAAARRPSTGSRPLCIVTFPELHPAADEPSVGVSFAGKQRNFSLLEAFLALRLSGSLFVYAVRDGRMTVVPVDVQGPAGAAEMAAGATRSIAAEIEVFIEHASELVLGYLEIETSTRSAVDVQRAREVRALESIVRYCLAGDGDVRLAAGALLSRFTEIAQ